MAKIMNLVSFFGLVLLWPKALAIDTMVNEFSSLTSATRDIISKLRIVSERAAFFVDSASSVGAFIATAAKIAFEPESEEQKSIKTLHEFVKTQLDAISQEIQKETSSIKFYLVDQEFEEKIIIPLMNIEGFYIEITNPLRDRSQYQKEFIAHCERPITSPSGVLIVSNQDFLLKILVVLDRFLKSAILIFLKDWSVSLQAMSIAIKRKPIMTNCNLKSNEETEGYVAVLELFQKIEQQHLQNLTMPMAEYEFIKSSLLAKASWPDMQNELKKILRTENCTVVEEALRKLHSNLQKTGSYNRCWLKTIAEGNSWLRDPLLHFAEIIRLEFMKAVLIAAHCNNFFYTGETIEIENRKIGLLLKEIAAYVADWISTRLAMTWPTISSAYAKTIAKGKSPIIESKEEYERVAKALKLVLDEMGEAKYKHTVIVFPHWTDERQVATICPSTFCFTLYNLNEINVIVVRYEYNQHDRAQRAWQWFTPMMKSDMHRIIIKWWAHNKSKPLIGLALEMKKWFKGLCDPEFYAHLVLIRNWMWSEVDAKITLGITETEINAVKTQQGFDVKKNPRFADAEIFHVHMLL